MIRMSSLIMDYSTLSFSFFLSSFQLPSSSSPFHLLSLLSLSFSPSPFSLVSNFPHLLLSILSLSSSQSYAGIEGARRRWRKRAKQELEKKVFNFRDTKFLESKPLLLSHSLSLSNSLPFSLFPIPFISKFLPLLLLLFMHRFILEIERTIHNTS